MQYYQLLIHLLQFYLKEEKKHPEMPPLFNHKEVLNEYVKKMIKYKSHEEKGKTLSEDHNMSGYMKII